MKIEKKVEHIAYTVICVVTLSYYLKIRKEERRKRAEITSNTKTTLAAMAKAQDLVAQRIEEGRYHSYDEAMTDFHFETIIAANEE